MKKSIILSTLLATNIAAAATCNGERCFEASNDDILKYQWDASETRTPGKLQFKGTLQKEYLWLYYKCDTPWLGDKYYVKSQKQDSDEYKRMRYTKEIDQTYTYELITNYQLTGTTVPQINVSQRVIADTYHPNGFRIFDAGSTPERASVGQVYNYNSDYQVENVEVKFAMALNAQRRAGDNRVINQNSYLLQNGSQVNLPNTSTPIFNPIDLGTIQANEANYFQIDTDVRNYESSSKCWNDSNLKFTGVPTENFRFRKKTIPFVDYKAMTKPETFNGEIEYFFNFSQTKLFAKLGNQIVATFNRANVDATTGFSESLKDEALLLDNLLENLKGNMRPSIYRQTYGDIEVAIENLKIKTQAGGTVLHDNVRQEFEAAYLLVTKIVDKEIEKDKVVKSYGAIVNSFLAHLNYLNSEFFQFDPEEPGVKIITLTAKNIQLASERTLQVIKGTSDNAEVLAAVDVLEEMVDMTEDLIVMDPLGSLDASILNRLYDMLDFYDDNFSEVEKALIDFNVEGQLSQIKSVFDLLNAITE